MSTKRTSNDPTGRKGANAVALSFTVIVPTLNAAAGWARFVSVLAGAAAPKQVLILDSSSTDGTPELARAAGFQVLSIPRSDFNHGGTRQFAAEMFSDSDVLIYMTQDAVLQEPHSFEHLLAAFEDPAVAVAYGRQLPRPEAGPIEAHARSFNYPAESEVRDLASRDRLGIKTIFVSNSFAAYRREALMAVGGFPRKIIFGEDTVTAARLLMHGWLVAYVAEARAFHSHGYTWRQEFKRYFDIGVLHSREGWLLEEFGHAGNEGGRFVRSELNYLSRESWWLIPSAALRTALKLTGYKLGRMEKELSLSIKRRLSLHPGFWKSELFQ